MVLVPSARGGSAVCALATSPAAGVCCSLADAHASALETEAAGPTVRGYIFVAADKRAVRAGAEALVVWVSMPSSR